MYIKDIRNKIDENKITYGTVLKVQGLVGNDDINTVMLINNITDGTIYTCKVLDLSSKEIIADFKDIKDFVNSTNIVKIGGQFDELFVV